MAESHSQCKNICCNPFHKPNHFIRKKDQFTKWMCEKASSISPGEKICDDCREKLAKASFPQTCDCSVSDSESDKIVSPPSDEELQVDTSPVF